jgi:hypothetical protein
MRTYSSDMQMCNNITVFRPNCNTLSHSNTTTAIATDNTTYSSSTNTTTASTTPSTTWRRFFSAHDVNTDKITSFFYDATSNEATSNNTETA